MNSSRNRESAESQAPTEWNVGDVILDLYEVKGIHEGGGMGLVYRVFHRGWNIDLAVKSPRPEFFHSERQKGDFIRECETWINLGLHPHIVSCHYVRTLGGIPRVFAEYVEGGSLKDWIDSRKLYEGGPQAALKRILDIAIQLAWGLNYAHLKGVIHQDVKPANVLMAPDGTAKVTDFGLSSARAATAESEQTDPTRSILASTGGMTPAYCSPEQANRQRLTRGSDIWSWAVSMLEMLAGEVCWQSGMAAPEVLRHLNDVRAEGVALPDPPPNVLELLGQCFALAPAQRPSDFQRVVDALEPMYRAVAGGEYDREEPEAPELQADALNNRAVSLLDIGRADEAEKCFDEALAKEPTHPQAIYNRGLRRWRIGRGTDDAIVLALQQSQQNRPRDGNLRHLMAWVHLERGDMVGALEALSEADKLIDSVEVKQALAVARQFGLNAPHCMRRLEGHTGPVSAVALTANGLWALSGSSDKTLRLWDLNSGRCLRTFESHTDEVTSVSLSADGRWALSGDEDMTLRLWDLSTGECSRTLEGHTDRVGSVALDADGRWALSGGEDKTLRLWDLSTGKCMRTLEGHTDSVDSVVLTADGCRALSGSGDGTLRLWELGTGICLRTFEGHAMPVTCVSLGADERWALSGGMDNTLRLWELSSGRCLWTLQGHTDMVTSVALSVDGRWALSGSWDKTLRFWELSSGRCLRTFEGHTDFVGCISFSGDGGRALSGGNDNTLRLWDTGLLFWDQLRPRAQPAFCKLSGAREANVARRRFTVLLEAAEQAFASGNYSETWKLLLEARSEPGYSFSSRALQLSQKAGRLGVCKTLRSAWHMRRLEGHTNSVHSVAVTADGRRALSGSSDQTLRLWDLSSGECLRTFAGHPDMVRFVALSADERLALSGGNDKTLRLWELNSGHCLRTFEGHTDFVDCISFSADGRRALSGGNDKTLRLWELGTGKCVRVIEGHTQGVDSVALSADGRWALSGSYDNTLRLWDLTFGECLRTYGGHKKGVTAVAISTEGRLGLSGSSDGTVRLWDLSTGKCLQVFAGHTGPVTSVALSPDGRWALSGGYDRTLRLWELKSGRCLRTFAGHTGWVFSVALSADGRWALSGSHNNTLRLWFLDWEYEFPDPADWDEKARPHLEIFLALHCLVSEDGFTRVGKPVWTEQDFQNLLTDLQYRGYGWLRPEGVRRQLLKMTEEWQVPPPLPGA